LSVEFATVTVVRAITVAAGVFAPGHLGGLTPYLPFDLVDAVLAETGRAQQRLRRLPSRVIVYFVIILGMFPGLGSLRIWDKLVAGLVEAGLQPPMPSETALRDARHRVGTAPFKALFEVVAGPLGRPGTPGVSYQGLRTVAFDGCQSFKAPDTRAHRGWLGKIRHPNGLAGYPNLLLMALVETGTRGLLGARFGPLGDGGEPGYATRLLHLLTPDMLVLLDRGFAGTDFLKAVAATKAHLLVRISRNRRPPVHTPLPDGSYLTDFDGLTLRIIEAVITTTTNSTAIQAEYRLATTLTDHHRHTATALLQLYHERWEIETAFYALRHTLFHGRVLRSTTRTGLIQELWALLTLYQLIRTAMTDATQTLPGSDPDRAGFTTAVEHARNQLINAAGILPDPNHPHHGGRIGTTAANTHHRRRDRTSQRRLKCPPPRYASAPAGDPRPTTSTTITGRSYTIQPRTHTPPPTPRPDRCIPTSDLSHHTLEYLNHNPGQPHSIREIADHLGINPDKARYKLACMTRRGYIIRTHRGHFATTPERATTNAPDP
jgi:hypothetical protein